MTIEVEQLRGEKQVIVREYEALKTSFEKLTKDLDAMKNNLNALHGAIQWANKLIRISENNLAKKVEPLAKSKGKKKNEKL